MTAPVFVDTSVFVYARDAGVPAKQRPALAWLDHLWRERRGRTSLQVLSEYYITVTRKLRPGLKPDVAWDDVTALFAWQPAAIDREIVSGARDIEARYGLSWWDSLVVAAAKRQDCGLLLSEDLQEGGVYAGVTVRSPFTLHAGELDASYAVEAPSARRHPARGRPTRARRRG